MNMAEFLTDTRAAYTACLLAAFLMLAGCNKFVIIPQQKMPPEQTNVWDGRVENVVYIKYKPWDEIFALHVFEDLLVPADEWPQKHFNNKRRLNEKLFKWEPDGSRAMRFSLEQKEIVPFLLEGRLWTESRSIRVEGNITNNSTYDWTPKNAAALMCFRAHLVKEFHDAQGTGIWLPKRDGNRQSVFNAIGMQYHPFFNFSCWQPDSPFEPRISKENKTKTRRITFESTQASALGGNRLETMSCIHANYALTAPRGAKAHFSSTITFEDLPEKSR